VSLEIDILTSSLGLSLNCRRCGCYSRYTIFINLSVTKRVVKPTTRYTDVLRSSKSTANPKPFCLW